MIEADIHGKSGVREDMLTSCVFGLFELLPDNYLIEILLPAKDIKGNNLNPTPLYDKVELEYWPWIIGSGEPDAIATLHYATPQKNIVGLKIVIEVKHGAPLSSPQQLANYYNGILRSFLNSHNIALIYLTHHHNMPKEDIENNLYPCENGGMGIY